MLIRSKLIRAGGSIITLGKGADARNYHFKATDPKKPDADHVCDVTDKRDISTLLAIAEGYEVHDAELPKAKASEPGKPVPAGNTESPDKTKAQLIAMVTEKTGKKPHPSTSIAKLHALLES